MTFFVHTDTDCLNVCACINMYICVLIVVWCLFGLVNKKELSKRSCCVVSETPEKPTDGSRTPQDVGKFQIMTTSRLKLLIAKVSGLPARTFLDSRMKGKTCRHAFGL